MVAPIIAGAGAKIARSVLVRRAASQATGNAQSSGGKPKKRIGILMGIFIVGFAGLIDLLQLFMFVFNALPVIGQAIVFIVPPILGIIGQITLAIWFKLCGVNYFSGKQASMKLVAIFGPGILEVAPVTAGMPLMALGASLMIALSRIEDKMAHEEQQKNTKQAQTLQQQQSAPPPLARNEQMRAPQQQPERGGRQQPAYAQNGQQTPGSPQQGVPPQQPELGRQLKELRGIPKPPLPALRPPRGFTAQPSDWR